MFLLQCEDGCGAVATTDCACPPEMADVPAHLAECPMTDIGANLQCKPGAGCCELPHSHDQAANACPGAGRHEGVPCPAGDVCRFWDGHKAHIAGLNPDNPVHMQVKAEAEALHGVAEGTCPGGHCGKGVPGCTVCRPITITAMAGTVSVRRAGAVA